LTHLKEVALEAAVKIPELLTGEQVATRLGISRERVRQLSGRPDFPPPLGRIGKAVVWSETDVEAYAKGTRLFFVVNGISIGVERAKELAARLERKGAPGGTDDRNRARMLAAAIRAQLELGSQGTLGNPGINVHDEQAAAVFAVLDKWLEDVGVDTFGEQLMDLRYRLHGEFPTGGGGNARG
jgi:prophage regulatory protein